LLAEHVNRVWALLPAGVGTGNQVATQHTERAEHEQPQRDKESQSQQCQREFRQ
jgi:hypothetical protein